jgi:hypothetical protein
MESAAEVAAALRRDGVECQALDIGGGFPIKYSDDVPPIEEIANEVYEVFNARFPKETELLIEPGRCIVGESAVLASTVIGRARRGDEDWLFLDASAFHGLLEAQQVKGRFPYPVKVTHNGQEKKEKYVLSGPTCDPDDTILAEVWLPETRVGDKLYILNTGAYSFVYATNFHGFAPPDIHFISAGQSLETLWGEKQTAEGFKPQYDEEKRYVVEHEGQTAKVYFGIRKAPQRWIGPLWDLYRESLRIEEAIQEQLCFTQDEFNAALVDPDYVKAVMLLDDEPAAFIMGTNNLEKATDGYINPAFIRKRFPEETKEGRFYYMPCVFTSPRLRHIGFLRQMVVALVDAIREKRWVLSLDVSDSRLFLPDVLVNIGAEEGLTIDKHLLGTQSYFAFTYEPEDADRKPVESEKLTPTQS